MRVEHEVVAVEPDQTRVRVRDLATGAVTVEPYDQLMVATGALPVRPDLAGIDADGIHDVQTLSDAEMLHRDLAVHDPSAAAVVGGGYIGFEIAEALVERGLHVTIVETNEYPMGSLDPDMGELVADGLRAVGVELCTCHRVEGFDVDPHGRVRGVTTPACIGPHGWAGDTCSALAEPG